MTNNDVWNHVGLILVKTVGVLMLYLELWMIGEDDQGDPTWFQTSLLVICSNFCFTNIPVSWLFLGQDLGVLMLHLELWLIGEDDQGDSTWFQSSLFVIWNKFKLLQLL